MKKTKLGRPKLPKGEAKSLMIRARVSQAEYKLVEGASKADGKELSEWVRTVLIGAATPK